MQKIPMRNYTPFGCQTAAVSISYQDNMRRVSRKNEDKKRRELNLLIRVKSLYALFPRGDIESSEEPDFLISAETNKIGIELTHYVRGQSSNGSKLRKNEVLRDQIVKLARSRFEDKHEERVSADFHWLRTDLQNGDRRKLADEIAALIATAIPNDIYERIVIEPDGAGKIDGLITRVSVRRTRPGSKGLWSNWECGPEGASVEEIQSLIS